MLWIFTGTENVQDLQLPPSLLEPNDRYIIHHEIWNAHWTRAIDISLDYLHIPVVHRNSFGNEGCKVPTDEPSLRFRRWYYRTVKSKRTEAIQNTSAG